VTAAATQRRMALARHAAWRRSTRRRHLASEDCNISLPAIAEDEPWELAAASASEAMRTSDYTAWGLGRLVQMLLVFIDAGASYVLPSGVVSSSSNSTTLFTSSVVSSSALKTPSSSRNPRRRIKAASMPAKQQEEPQEQAAEIVDYLCMPVECN